MSQTNSSGNIAFSEWRQSLWKNPWQGETVPGNEQVKVGAGTSLVKTAVRERTSPAYQANTDIFLLFGLYADGYFDRRPKKIQSSTTSSVQVGVSVNSPSVAYRGTIVYNPETNASVFFPASGRRKNTAGQLEYAGEARIIGVLRRHLKLQLGMESLSGLFGQLKLAVGILAIYIRYRNLVILSVV